MQAILGYSPPAADCPALRAPRDAPARLNIFFSGGEPAGDLHGANLIRELKRRRPDWNMVGYGGPRMERAGCRLHADLTRYAVMWLLQVILNYHKFRALVKQAERFFAEQRPDAVVLIDYPGFNWHIAKAAKKHGVPVFYYGAPQLWGWAGWRVKKMRRWVDHVLVKLPFEEQWYRDRGCNATYLGHPYFDELRAQQLGEDFVAGRRAAGPLVTILPGSRTQEVRSNLAAQLRAAEKIQAARPDVRFAIAAFKQSQVALVESALAEAGVQAEVHVGRTPELIHAATCCLAVSGSVSLELLYHVKPTAIVYCVSPFAFFVQRFFRRVRYITLVNLLTADELFPDEVGVYDPADPRDAHVLMPEYLTSGDPSDALAGHVLGWLDDAAARRELVARMTTLKERIAGGGASVRAADYVVDRLDPRADQTEAA